MYTKNTVKNNSFKAKTAGSSERNEVEEAIWDYKNICFSAVMF